jgi:hypothetical protein
MKYIRKTPIKKKKKEEERKKEAQKNQKPRKTRKSPSTKYLSALPPKPFGLQCFLHFCSHQIHHIKHKRANL